MRERNKASRFQVHLLITALLAVLNRCNTQNQSPFWSRAQQNLRLGDMRVKEPRKPPVINNTILSSPKFMPLCGNGRIDTKADYIAYYQNASNRPLTLTKREILYMYRGLSDPETQYSVSFSLDEVCDDGNKVDFDGCSADCMHLDLWTSPCELAVDLNLEYEDLIYDTARRSMVVSAKTGIYELDMVSATSTSLTARLIAPKTIQVTDIFRNSTSLILYSAEQQAFWQLVDGASTVTLLAEIQHLAKWNPSSVIRHCHQNPDGSVVIYDADKMVYLPTLTSTSYGFCSFGRAVSVCIFSQPQPNRASLFICGPIRVIIGPGICQVLTTPAIENDGSIWRDVFNKISYETFTLQMSVLSTYSVSPPIVPSLSPELSFEMYHPMGGFMEGAPGNARRLGDFTSNAGIFYYVGDNTLLDMAIPADFNENSKTCGSDRCIFDIDRGYDIFSQNPLKNSFGKTWNDFLQEQISQEATVSPQLSNLASLKSDPQRYDRLLDSFASAFRSTVSPLVALAIQKHPVTLNTWALRKDKLIEISKSGVQLKRADGKCIPSGVALCPYCFWAPNGQKCRPCSEKDASSWSWNMKCKTCAATAGRRLLTEESNSYITFVLAGNTTRISSAWPSAVTDPTTSLTTVSISTSDTVSAMRSIQLQLLEMTDVQVITRPYVVIGIGSYPSGSQSQDSPDNMMIIILAAGIPCLAFIILISIYATYHWRTKHLSVPYQPLHPVYILRR